MPAPVPPLADSDAEAPASAEAPKKARRAYLPAKERRRRIIAAAQEVFARSNLQGARTRDIARAAEVNQATLFEHFESKEAIFHAAVVEPLLEAMRGMHDRKQSYKVTQSLDEVQAVAEISVRRHLDVMVEIFPLFTAALFSDLELGRKLYREQIMPLFQERSEAMRSLVRDGLDPELVELATFGIFFAVAMDRTFKGETKDLGAISEQVTKLATTGFVRDFD